jgi:hypothetical protein
MAVAVVTSNAANERRTILPVKIPYLLGIGSVRSVLPGSPPRVRRRFYAGKNPVKGRV